VKVESVPAPLVVGGPWELTFQPHRGAPDKIMLERLISWSEHSNPGVKYFSGTGTYRTRLNVPAALLGAHRRVFLDLGRVEVIAEVAVNDRELGVLWKTPFRVDVTDALKAGENTLQVKVVNLWPNRMIGDEQLPNDCWGRNANGKNVMKAWPDWLVKGTPRTSGRITLLASMQQWKKNDPLIPSGLLGPVTLRTVERRSVP
jgi:hypothetical protein